MVYYEIQRKNIQVTVMVLKVLVYISKTLPSNNNSIKNNNHNNNSDSSNNNLVDVSLPV